MASYVVRLWLPDRPGALGAVASRIGAVRGDLVAIDILERGAGRAIDELVVELPEEELVPLLVKELHEVDGVDVEEVRMLSTGSRRDPRLAALEAAAAVVAQRTPSSVLELLVEGAQREFDTVWAAVVDLDRGTVSISAGETPPGSWVTAFAAGATADAATGDVAWAPLETGRLALVVGRPGRALRAVERRQLAALAAIADTRWTELSRRGSLSVHPSAV